MITKHLVDWFVPFKNRADMAESWYILIEKFILLETMHHVVYLGHSVRLQAFLVSSIFFGVEYAMRSPQLSI